MLVLAYLSAQALRVCFPLAGICHSRAATQQADCLLPRTFTPLKEYYISKPGLTCRQVRSSLRQYKVPWYGMKIKKGSISSSNELPIWFFQRRLINSALLWHQSFWCVRLLHYTQSLKTRMSCISCCLARHLPVTHVLRCVHMRWGTGVGVSLWGEGGSATDFQVPQQNHKPCIPPSAQPCRGWCQIQHSIHETNTNSHCSPLRGLQRFCKTFGRKSLFISQL